MGKILPIILALIGVGAGVGAGFFLRPEPALEDTALGPCGDMQTHEEEAHESSEEDEVSTLEYVKLNNQFVIPVVDDARVAALVVVSLTVEVRQGRKEDVYLREPKLRDAFLQVFFDHANSGGFKGAFTNSSNMDVLRKALLETANDTAKGLISDVLIMDIARQDV
ncbi:flagellar basal body-associated FliL family protein [Lentibacter sp.]|uniref:flagellar basal body-associated FliL family protein n=1 Tax=Lentibacter sp. TaxID=2024994 RepID=UPI003F6C9CF4